MMLKRFRVWREDCMTRDWAREYAAFDVKCAIEGFIYQGVTSGNFEFWQDCIVTVLDEETKEITRHVVHVDRVPSISSEQLFDKPQPRTSNDHEGDIPYADD